MPGGLNKFISFILVALSPLVLAHAAAACSMAGCSNNGQEMQRSFTIFVTHDDKPLAGVAVHVAHKGTELLSTTTDAKGAVHIRELAPGDYWLNADTLGTGVVYTCFHVNERPSRAAKVRLSYTWGDEAPATNRIAGRLVDSQPGRGGTPIWNLVHRTDAPVVGADVRVRDPLTHAVYTTNSDQDGQFSFDGLPNGTYVLHIEGGAAGDRAYDATDEVIRLDSSAARNWLAFRRADAGGGSCGGTELELQSH
jgi:hypothetical protein